MHILIVCTGNICRSPMGEALLRALLESRGATGIRVSSAGTWGLDGEPATSNAVAVMAEAGIDLSDHRARTLEVGHLEQADLVVAMTSVHESDIGKLHPEALAKVRLAKELSALGTDAGIGLDMLLAAERPEWRRATDLDDPYGMPLAVYRRTAAEIKRQMEVLADALSG